MLFRRIFSQFNLVKISYTIIGTGFGVLFWIRYHGVIDFPLASDSIFNLEM